MKRKAATSKAATSAEMRAYWKGQEDAMFVVRTHVGAMTRAIKEVGTKSYEAANLCAALRAMLELVDEDRKDCFP